jgi:hypothetical protein
VEPQRAEIELDQRSRKASLRLEQIERLLKPPRCRSPGSHWQASRLKSTAVNLPVGHRPPSRLCRTVALGGSYRFGGGGSGSRTGSGLILARIALRVLMRAERK